ncbi:hypothetical protein [Neptuniibacter sp. UBA847]|uniref:hypothetical protein n=1 Tax=Neptuniibacter sp. UBA847 TaxID=1946977 RepID=UPI000C42679F|nr:hypothetical protein [Neptuniibacter sp. UBA847]MAY42272.1 hypothetical protein [Oceanospirillaceae bacterium]|tara:strand:+ start:5537 stop:5872 length:336 start_codon:yes stop_codon:yes gene_type:complete
MNFTVYVTLTGEITSTITGTLATAELNKEASESVIAGTYDDELYWINPSNSTAELKEDYTIDALPIPCTARIEDIEYSITSQPTFEFDSPGDYEIEIDAGPAYLRKVFNVS